MKITGIVVNPSEGVAQQATIEKSLDGYYKLLDCSCIDIVSRRIGGKRYLIVCDDEALCKENPVITAISSDRQPMLFGALFVVKSDDRDDVRSLTDSEAAHILRCRVTLRDPKKHTWQALYPCNY